MIELLEPEIEALGYELVDLELSVGHGNGLVRVYIDKDGGVTLDDCEKTSHQISALMEVEDPIPEHYTLEVSSPGLNRTLRTADHFVRFAGKRVKVELKRLHEGRKRFTGELVGIDGTEVILTMDETEIRLPIDGINKARLVPNL